MASFVIALLVGGLDVMLAVVIAVGIAKAGVGSAKPGYGEYPRGVQQDITARVVGGGMSMVCLNCMSVPLCLVGVGLAVVGLIGHRDRNHLFTWIGLLGNGVVIIGVLALYVLGSMAG